MKTKQITGYVKSNGKADEPLTFALSTEEIDRGGDLILVDGWQLDNFEKNPIALWSHDSYRLPIGVWENVRKQGKELLADLKLASTDFAQMVGQLIRENVLKAVSVGLLPIEMEPFDKEKPWSGSLIKEAELIEASVVNVPQNASALRIVKSFSLEGKEADFVKYLVSESADSDIIDNAKRAIAGPDQGSDGELASKTKTLRKTNILEYSTMSLSEKIESKQVDLVTIRDELTKAVDIYSEEPTDENKASVEAFTEKADELEDQLTTLQKAEQSLAAACQPGQRAAAPGIVKSVKNYEPGELIFRLATAKLLAFVNNTTIDQVVRDRYSTDKGFEAILTKATDAVPALTTESTWAGDLLQEQVVGFVDLIANNSVYGVLQSRGMSFTFSGGSPIRIPSRDATPTLAGDFVGEGAPIPVRQSAISSKTIVPKKLAAISTMSEEIAEATSGQLETIVRQGIIDDTSKILDTRLFDAIAASAVRPAGLMVGVTTITSAGGTVANIITDLKALLGAFNVDDAAKNVVIIMHPLRRLGASTAINAVGVMQFAEELSRGTLLGIPVATSSNVATDEVHAVNAGEFVAAGGQPTFRVSNTATLHMEQDLADVKEIVSGTGPTTADPVRSLFQTNSIGIKVTWPVNWVMRRDAQVSGLDTVAW